MNLMSRIPAGTDVIRGADLHHQAHALAYPSRVRAQLRTVDEALVCPDATTDHPDAYAQGLRRGLEEGRIAALAERTQAELFALGQARDAAVATAREAGFASAQAEAREALVAALAAQREASDRDAGERIARLEQMAAALTGAYATALSIAEDDLVTLAFEATCTIIGRAAVSHEAIEVLAAQLVGARQGTPSLRLHVHPDDLALVRSRAAPPADTFEWVADPDVTNGIVLRSVHGSVDARLDRQLANFADLLRTTRAQRMNSPRAN
jgi:flagellar assembly protein FliH